MTSRFLIPSNFSYDDPLPFECTNDPNTEISLILYFIQATYLLLGILLNILIIRVIFFSNNTFYKSNSFYILYTADAFIGICKCLFEILTVRIFTFITPLCSIISPFFFTPSILMKISYSITHYSTSFRTISQIFMSFNRMTCVIFPFKHDKLWKRIIHPVIFILFVIPFDTIWLIIMSRVYINPSGYGFSINYREITGLPKLSLIHLIEFTIGFVLVISSFIMTIIGLTTLEHRLKSAERSLTFVTMIMALQTLLLAIIQIYFAFLTTTFPNIRQFLFQIVPFVSDSASVFSPIALISTNKKLKLDILRKKYPIPQGASRSVSMTQLMFRVNSRIP